MYESNQEDVRDAQQDLDEKEFNNKIDSLDKAIEELEKQKENSIKQIDEQIEAWEKYAENIDKVTHSYEDFIAMQDFIEVFGGDAIGKILSKDEDIIDKFEQTLNNVKAEADEIQQKIDANDRLIKSIQAEADAYLKNSQAVEEARGKIKDLITNNEEEIEAITETSKTVKDLSQTWTDTKDNIETALDLLNKMGLLAKDNEKKTLSERIENLKNFQKEAIWIYGTIETALNDAKLALSQMENIANKSKKPSGKTKSVDTNATLDSYHTGGIVGASGRKLPENLIALADYDLKPNETIAKLLNGEVVLNNTQIKTMFDNLGGAYKSLVPLQTKDIDKEINSITIGDVNVYNPNDSDEIVNEIVKELPLKVIQRLNSRNK